jgi:iron complex outermembrane recepter protein
MSTHPQEKLKEMSSQDTRLRRAVRLIVATGLVLAQARFNSALADSNDAPSASDAASADNDESLPSVVVTALKRETVLQETPAAITALSGSALHDANITDLNSLTTQVPGLVITTAGPGQNQVALRGIRSSGDAQVGIYFGETPVVGPPGTTSDPAASSSDIRLFDVEQVEVLSGPQGTLYGAGAMGGAIRVNFKKPDFNTYGAVVDVSTSNTDGGREGYNANGAVNIPLIDDVLAARLVGYDQYTGGWIDNPGLGLRDDNTNRAYGGRALVRFQPTKDLTIDGLVSDQEEKGGPPDWSPSQGDYNAIERAVLTFKDTTRLYSLTANDELGFARLTATASYQDRPLLMERDPTSLFVTLHALQDTPTMYYQPQSVTDTTSEVRLQSSTPGPFQWTLGGYYENRIAKVTSDALVLNDNGTVPDPFGSNLILQRFIGDYLKQKAAFVELSYEILNGLTFTQGGRYYDYEKTVSGLTTLGLPLLGTKASPYNAWDADNTGFLNKSNLAYKLNESVFVYGQAASGFRPGGVNQAIGLATATPYLPDRLWTYEVGLKTRLLNDSLNVNLTAYRTNWNDMQVSLTGVGYSYLGNAGSARVQGVEVEIIDRPLPGLQLSANATGLSALLTSDQLATGATSTAATGRTGDRIPNIPEITATVGAQYDWALGSNLTALVRGDASYVGRSFTDFHYSSSTPFYSLGNYTVFNGRAGINKNGWGVYLYGNNLFNRFAIVSAANLIGGSTETAVTVPPRTIGLNVNKSF